MHVSKCIAMLSNSSAQLANSKCALSFFHSHQQQQSTQLWLKKYNIYTTTVCACPQV